jgi:Sortilin, neurotensin receptor 3,
MKVQKKITLALLTGLLMIASGCTSGNKDENKTKQENTTEINTKFEIVQAQKIKAEQIRGIGYPGNDKALYLAADDGLKMFTDSKWYETTTNHHEYTGFQAIDSGFIASGTPQKGTGLKDMLGIVQSEDKGKSLKKLAFYGENNFYFLAASFTGESIYVINDQKDADLDLGVNYSTDHGETWKTSELKNFDADSLGMMAVHPENDKIFAMSTRSGIYYSEDHGNTVKLISDPFMVTALTFIGDNILFSSVEHEKIVLKSINPNSGEQSNLNFPFLDYQNPITFLAVNPKNHQQIAFSTYKNDLYESMDGGSNWSNLLKNGKAESK